MTSRQQPPVAAGGDRSATATGQRQAVSGRGNRRRRRDLMVPEAEFRSYYGRPVLKQPAWTLEVPWYFFVGGMAGASAPLAAAARAATASGADAPAMPPTKKYQGTSIVQAGSLRIGWP